MLLTALSNCVSPIDSAVINNALKVKRLMFKPDTAYKLVNVMSRYDSQVLPTPSNLKQQLLQVARFEFIVKPKSILTSTNTKTIPEEVSFWQKMSTDKSYQLYRVLAAKSINIFS